MAHGVRGVKKPHPLGSVPSRSGASQLTAESGVVSVTVPGVKISALPAASGGTGSDQFEVNQSGTSRRITTAQLATALPPVDWSSITGKPTSLPPNGPASGDLAGTYPAPTIKPSATNGQVLTTVGGVSVWATSTAGSTVIPAGSVAYGGATGAVTGVLADFAWDATNKRLGVGTSTPGALAEFRSATAGTKALIVRGTTTSASQDYFDIILTDPTGGGGSAMRVMGGATGINPLFQVDRAGDTQVSGWLRVLSTSGLVTNGADYFGAMLGNGAGGNLGTFAGLGAPTFSTFGSYGSIYLNGSSPGLPYYNSNGTTGWDRLVGESATQTLSNKTFGATTFTGAITGTTATMSGEVTGLWGAFTDNVNGAHTALTARNASTGSSASARLLLDLSNVSFGFGIIEADRFTNSVRYVAGSGLANGHRFENPLTGTTATFAGNVNGIHTGLTLENDNTGNGTTERLLFNLGGIANAYSLIELADGSGINPPNMHYFTGAGVTGGHWFDGPVNLANPLTGTTATFSGTVTAPGAQIQMVSVETGAVATGTTVIPRDDTIPQITEGDQYMTLAITPRSATSKLVIEVIACLTNTVTGNMAVALFQDATANALAVVSDPIDTAGRTLTIPLTHTMTSGTTSATTFRVRAGCNNAGTTTFNGEVGARLFGGVMASSIVIREVAP